MQTGAMAVLLFLMAGVVVHAWRFGVAGLTGDALPDERFRAPGAALANAGIFAHMLAGAVLSVLAPLQLVPGIRRRWPFVHRWSGRLAVALATVTALGGLVFIATRGTIGGAPMDAGFALYGGLVLLAAGQTFRHARAGRLARHRDWALRLFVLAIGSWLYRLHYALWFLMTGGAGHEPDFSGPFDLVQNVAFYLPYLLAVEAFIRWQRRRAGAGGGPRTAGPR